jgi:pimeloyl-ACP methyl ester carboxylesterase
MLMLPGYNEPAEHLDTLAHGRNGLPGLRAHGFECVKLSPCWEQLRERIDRIAAYIEDLRAQGYPFPITILGYSLGGLVARGYLRAHPRSAHDVEAIVTLGTPHFGVVTHVLPKVAALLRVPDRAIGDLAHESDFLAWLNGTPGHFARDPRTGARRWEPDAEPFVAPAGVGVYTIAGLLTKRWRDHGDGDGVVSGNSASMASRLPAHYIVGPHCNHMNLIGHFDPLVCLSMGFAVNDLVWPHTLRAIIRFCGARSPATANV